MPLCRCKTVESHYLGIVPRNIFKEAQESGAVRVLRLGGKRSLKKCRSEVGGNVM